MGIFSLLTTLTSLTATYSTTTSSLDEGSDGLATLYTTASSTTTTSAINGPTINVYAAQDYVNSLSNEELSRIVEVVEMKDTQDKEINIDLTEPSIKVYEKKN